MSRARARVRVRESKKPSVLLGWICPLPPVRCCVAAKELPDQRQNTARPLPLASLVQTFLASSGTAA